MYYRYELYVDDEFQEVGFLQGLDDTGLPQWRLNELISAFDDMPIPEDIFKQYRTESWFTEAGQSYFEDAIDDVIAAYEQDGLFDVERRECVALPEDDIVYADQWQVILGIAERF